MSKCSLCITDFFDHVLNAPLHCIRWSWGAKNAQTGEIYLRCWSDELVKIDGKQYVQVQWLMGEVNTNGRTERELHLKEILSGVPGWLIVAHPKDRHSVPRKIDGYNHEKAWRLGTDAIVKDGVILLPVLDPKPLPKLHEVVKC